MTFLDVLRYAMFGFFGAGVGFMLMTNIIAFAVLRPSLTPRKQNLGFLWWHVTSISISFLCLGVVAVEGVTTRIGEPATWRTWVTLLGTSLFAAAQILIFAIERRRLVDKRARAVVDLCEYERD